jgi:hypothetical protein
VRRASVRVRAVLQELLNRLHVSLARGDDELADARVSLRSLQDATD